MCASMASVARGSGLGARSLMYALLACHQMANYITRLAVPFIVPFIVQEFGYSESARAMLLNCFTPGYVLLQIPAGWFAARWGAKRLISCQCLVISAVLVALPAAARRGAWGAAACIFAFGLAQAPFSVGSNIAKANWVPTGKERAWALMLISLGTTLSKNISSVITPWLSGRSGWRAVTAAYAAGVGAFVLAWQLLASEHPKKAITTPPPSPSRPAVPLRPETTTARAAAAARVADADAVALSPSRSLLPPTSRLRKQHTPAQDDATKLQDAPAENVEDKIEQISIWRLLGAAPTMANILNHMQHDMHEFQVLGAWAPTYYNQVLGVALADVGKYTVWPMLCAIPAKFLIAAWESTLVGRGWSVREIRRAAGAIAAVRKKRLSFAPFCT